MENSQELKAIREDRRLTLMEVAIAVGDGTGPDQVSRWERGETEPRGRSRAAYAKALGLTVEELGALIYGRWHDVAAADLSLTPADPAEPAHAGADVAIPGAGASDVPSNCNG